MDGVFAGDNVLEGRACLTARLVYILSVTVLGASSERLVQIIHLFCAFRCRGLVNRLDEHDNIYEA
jgi:hypothetical protein